MAALCFAPWLHLICSPPSQGPGADLPLASSSCSEPRALFPPLLHVNWKSAQEVRQVSLLQRKRALLSLEEQAARVCEN